MEIFTVINVTRRYGIEINPVKLTYIVLSKCNISMVTRTPGHLRHVFT